MLWTADRLSLAALWVSYPLVAMTAMLTGFADRFNFQWIAIILATMQIMLAADASVKTKRRIRTSRGKQRKIDQELFRGSVALVGPLVAIGAAQDIFRRMLSIEYDPKALKILGYAPGQNSFFYLAMLGGLWVILIAYIGKYRWDYFIELREEAVDNTRRLKRQRKRSKHDDPSSSQLPIE